jgi:hypothetical protein
VPGAKQEQAQRDLSRTLAIIPSLFLHCKGDIGNLRRDGCWDHRPIRAFLSLVTLGIVHIMTGTFELVDPHVDPSGITNNKTYKKSIYRVYMSQ